jgi:hypothetical protein
VFVFFKGINNAQDGNNQLTATVTNGLPAGFYRVCTLVGNANHSPLQMPVAQRGGQDDCKYFSVGQGTGNAGAGAGAGAGAANNSNGAPATTAAAAGATATNTVADAGKAAGAAANNATAATGKTGKGGKGNKGGRRQRIM